MKPKTKEYIFAYQVGKDEKKNANFQCELKCENINLHKLSTDNFD